MIRHENRFSTDLVDRQWIEVLESTRVSKFNPRVLYTLDLILLAIFDRSRGPAWVQTGPSRDGVVPGISPDKLKTSTKIKHILGQQES